jgi:hypothetical protein
MLARRFTIVCLLTALFGILFAILVAEASRSTRSRNSGVIVSCTFKEGSTCTAARRG